VGRPPKNGKLELRSEKKKQTEGLPLQLGKAGVSWTAFLWGKRGLLDMRTVDLEKKASSSAFTAWTKSLRAKVRLIPARKKLPMNQGGIGREGKGKNWFVHQSKTHQAQKMKIQFLPHDR